MAFGDNVQNVARQSGATPQTIAFGSNVTAGNLLVVFATVNAVTVPSTVTVTDTLTHTYTKLEAYSTPQQVMIWYAVATSSGANTVTVTRSGSGSVIIVSLSEFEGPFAPTLVGDSSTDATFGTATSTGDITPTRSNSLLVGYISADGTLTQTSDWTVIENNVELSTYCLENAYKLQSGIVTEDYSATQGIAQVWGAVGLSFNPTTIDLSAGSGSYAITGTAVTLQASSIAGFIYRVDVGTAFDTANITSYVTLPWTQAPNPQSHDKTVQWLDLTAYLKGTATVNVDARFANEPHEFSAATFTTYGTISATPDGDKGFVYLGVTSRWMQVRLRATALAFEIQPPIVVGFNQTGRRI